MTVESPSPELGSPPGPPATYDHGCSEAVRACRILIIDDEEPNVRLLQRLLAKSGFENFLSTTDPREAAALFADFEPDLVLTDWLMPEVDGLAVIQQVRSLTATDDYLPLVVLTADTTPQTKKRALSAGATDFLTKPFDQIEVLLRIRNLLQARLSHVAVEAQKAALEASVFLRTSELEHTLTELKQTQKQVVQQERLAALGTMAGGIAHDFNNSLGIIMGFTEMLLRDAETGEPSEDLKKSLTTILTAAEDAAKIVHRLRDFYRSDEADEQRIAVDLNELIDQAVSLTRPRWKTHAIATGREIVVRTDLAVSAPMSGNPAELREVLTNMIFNAVDAMPEGGAVTIRTQVDGDSLLLKVTDTGTGMNEEIRRRCLEPFFTTKGESGTGLGLSMVFCIIQRHGGTIEIESAEGQGTTFTMRLPAVRAENVTSVAAESVTTRPLHILVVDDQPVLCQLVCEYLQDDLHTVAMATSGSQAMELFRASEFDLVITDHVMAEMNGHQLATAIKALKPNIPLILLTGYADSALPDDSKCVEGIDLLLAKPLSRTALRCALAQVTGLNRR